MKLVFLQLLKISPALLVTIIVAYILEELLEDFVSEMASDFVYPLASLVVISILWWSVFPTLEAYLKTETKGDNDNNNQTLP